MKRQFIIGLAALVASVAAILALPTPDPTGRVTLSWTYTSPVSSDQVFKIYQTTNAALAMTNWQLIATVPGTNRSIILQIVPGPNFFAMTSSNFWGESDFSAAVSTPALPSSAANLSITRTN